MSDKPEGTVPISDLELVHWVEEKDSMRGHARARGIPLSGSYVTFDDMRDAILEKGPIVIATPKADLAMFVLEGRFDNQIMVLRQSGINVRRFLVRETTFESMFGNFRGWSYGVSSEKPYPGSKSPFNTGLIPLEKLRFRCLSCHGYTAL